MEWSDVASIVFVCVTANHLGLIEGFENVIGRSIPIANCSKCLTWWATAFYMIVVTHDMLFSLATSFAASYAAIWLELIEGFVDTFYVKLYGKIITTNSHDTSASDTECGNSESIVS